MPTRSPSAVGAILLLATSLSACGARTALETPDSDGGSPGEDAPAELCDGIDNDSDGRIDEDLPTVECGVGACRRSACDGMCVPGVPSAELCGGGDDDCDGVIDEGLSLGALGPVVEVREGAGGYDRCGTCSWAYAPILVPREGGGVYVHWNHGIYGGEEIPNMWGRVLDAEGRTLGEPEPIGDRVRLGAARIPGLDASEGLVYATERVGASDLGRLWRFAPGSLEQVDIDVFERCSRATSLAYVGDRLVTACMSRGEAELRSQRIGEPGTMLTLDVDDMFYGGVLHPHPIEGEVLLAAYNVDTERDERWMSFARISPTLDVEPLIRTEATYTNGTPAFAVPGGWIWWNLRWPDGVGGELLDQNGELLGPIEPYPYRAANPPLANVHLGGGHHLIVIPATDFDEPMYLVRIDERGGLVQQLAVDVPPNPAGDPDFTAHIDLIEHRGELWTAWVGSYPADGEPNHVNVQRFGCVAP